MKKFVITISNGYDTDSFTLSAKSKEDARFIAKVAHTGTGWDVVHVNSKK